MSVVDDVRRVEEIDDRWVVSTIGSDDSSCWRVDGAVERKVG